MVKLGLVIYDLFGRKHRTMPPHRLMSASAARRVLPGLSPAIKAVAEYYDARVVHPERLTLEVIGDAETDCPASRALNYIEVEGLEGGKVVLRDRQSDERFTIAPRLVVNTAGAWVDGVQGRLRAPGKLIGGTKGVHLVIANPEQAAELGGRMLYFETSDHRACLVYPLDARHILLGTTDTRTDDPDDAVCSGDDILYLLDEMHQILPGRRITSDQIVFTYGGVRPLPTTDAVATGAISRDHILKSFEPTTDRPFPMVTLVGGKWTTYRACAAQIADSILARIGVGRKISTDKMAIGGGREFPRSPAALADLVAELAAGFDLSRAAGSPPDPTLWNHRRRLRGRRARGTGLAVKKPARLHLAGDLAHLPGGERVVRLSDVILRRTLIPFEGAATKAAVEEISGIVGAALGWSDVRRTEEVEQCLALLRQRHGVRIETAHPVAAHA